MCVYKAHYKRAKKCTQYYYDDNTNIIFQISVYLTYLFFSLKKNLTHVLHRCLLVLKHYVMVAFIRSGTDNAGYEPVSNTQHSGMFSVAGLYNTMIVLFKHNNNFSSLFYCTCLLSKTACCGVYSFSPAVLVPPDKLFMAASFLLNPVLWDRVFRNFLQPWFPTLGRGQNQGRGG